VDQLAENSYSHFCYSPIIISGSAGRVQLVPLLLLSTQHPWISWQSTAGHTSVTLHSSPIDQLAEYTWTHFCYPPLITRGSAGRVQLVTLLLLFTYHPWISWQSTAGHTSVTLQSSPVCQLSEHTRHTSVTLHSTPVCQLAEYSWSHFYYSPLITRGSTGRAQLVTLLLLSSHHPWISWQSTAGHSSVTLHSSPVNQLAEHSWSHFCYSPLITRGSASRVQLVTLLLLSTYHPWISWQSTAGHTSVALHSSPVCQLAEHTGHTSVTLHSSSVDQLAEHSCSHFCCSQLITRGSAGRAQLVTLMLLFTHHQWISWLSTAGHTSVTIHSSPVDQLAEHNWSQFCYSPLITHWVSLQSTVGYTSATLHS
jgi:hypothetical protein